MAFSQENTFGGPKNKELETEPAPINYELALESIEKILNIKKFVSPSDTKLISIEAFYEHIEKICVLLKDYRKRPNNVRVRDQIMYHMGCLSEGQYLLSDVIATLVDSDGKDISDYIDDLKSALGLSYN